MTGVQTCALPIYIIARISTGVWTPAWSGPLTPLSFVLDHSVHFTDLVQFFCGPVRWLCAAPSRAGESRFGFAVVLGSESGASGCLEISNHESRGVKIGRAHVRTPVTNAHLVCRLLLENKTKRCRVNISRRSAVSRNNR